MAHVRMPVTERPTSPRLTYGNAEIITFFNAKLVELRNEMEQKYLLLAAEFAKTKTDYAEAKVELNLQIKKNERLTQEKDKLSAEIQSLTQENEMLLVENEHWRTLTPINAALDLILPGKNEAFERNKISRKILKSDATDKLIALQNLVLGYLYLFRAKNTDKKNCDRAKVDFETAGKYFGSQETKAHYKLLAKEGLFYCHIYQIYLSLQNYIFFTYSFDNYASLSTALLNEVEKKLTETKNFFDKEFNNESVKEKHKELTDLMQYVVSMKTDVTDLFTCRQNYRIRYNHSRLSNLTDLITSKFEGEESPLSKFDNLLGAIFQYFWTPEKMLLQCKAFKALSCTVSPSSQFFAIGLGDNSRIVTKNLNKEILKAAQFSETFRNEIKKELFSENFDETNKADLNIKPLST